MNKANFIDMMQKHNNESSKAQTEKALNAFLEALTDALSDGQFVTLSGIGTFSVTQRQARQGRNPRTGEQVDIPACKVVKFKPGKHLKEAVK